MWTNLNCQSAAIEQVFKPLYEKSCEYNRPWSIAELRLQQDELEWLQSWFNSQAINNDLMISNSKSFNEISSTYRQMFGALLICAGAEICREKSREDSIWPIIRSILPKSHAFYHEFFLSNGQPSPLIKEIIGDIVRVLNLRNVMDIEGTQQWFVTIKLQIGFTYNGAKNRLAEWLVNLGQPHAVQYLNGDSQLPELSSKSFQSLWRALIQYRRNLITDNEIRETLKGNPWIKDHWINDLMKEAKARITILGTGEEHLKENQRFHEESSDEEFKPIINIGLEWLQNCAPRYRFQLDKQAIEEKVSGSEFSELDFYIDGKRLCRWLRQRDGSWDGEELIYGEPDNEKNQPNLYPRTLVIMSLSENLVEWDFTESGLMSEVLIFDMDRGTIVKTGFERLEQNRYYAIICSRECQIKNCVLQRPPYERNKSSRKVIALSLPLSTNLCIVYDDFILWQPIQEENDNSQYFSIKLITPTDVTLSLNERSKLILIGIPEDAESVKLLIHKNIYEVQRDQDSKEWYTLKEITLTPELLARQRRVRVRFIFNKKAYTREPRLELKALGVAMLCYQQEGGSQFISYKVLKKGDQLNRSEGTTYLRVWAPEQNTKPVIFEGNCRLPTLRNNRIPLRSLPGHGGELNIMSHGDRYNLQIASFDKGCIQSFTPSILGCDARISFLSEKDHREIADDGYEIFTWNLSGKNKAKFQKVPVSNIIADSNNQIWKIKELSNPMAVALTWKGSWLGSWWDLEQIIDFINSRNDLSEHDFTILKWLRVPILNSQINAALKNAILRSPCHFIRSWKKDTGLPNDVQPHNNFPEVDFVIRHFLWNQFLTGYIEDIISFLTQEDIHWYLKDTDTIIELEKLSEISPILLWKGIEKCIKYKQKNISILLKTFIYKQVGLLPNENKHFEYRLEEQKKRVLFATGLNEGRLKKIISLRIKSLVENQWNPLEQDRIDLMKVGQTQSGRKYLAIYIGQYWLASLCK